MLKIKTILNSINKYLILLSLNPSLYINKNLTKFLLTLNSSKQYTFYNSSIISSKKITYNNQRIISNKFYILFLNKI